MDKQLTLKQAIEWNNSSEKIIWYCDEFNASVNDSNFDEDMVDVENEFEDLLTKNGIDIKWENGL